MVIATKKIDSAIPEERKKSSPHWPHQNLTKRVLLARLNEATHYNINTGKLHLKLDRSSFTQPDLSSLQAAKYAAKLQRARLAELKRDLIKFDNDRKANKKEREYVLVKAREEAEDPKANPAILQRVEKNEQFHTGLIDAKRKRLSDQISTLKADIDHDEDCMELEKGEERYEAVYKIISADKKWAELVMLQLNDPTVNPTSRTRRTIQDLWREIYALPINWEWDKRMVDLDEAVAAAGTFERDDVGDIDRITIFGEMAAEKAGVGVEAPKWIKFDGKWIEDADGKIKDGPPDKQLVV